MLVVSNCRLRSSEPTVCLALELPHPWETMSAHTIGIFTLAKVAGNHYLVLLIVEDSVRPGCGGELGLSGNGLEETVGDHDGVLGQLLSLVMVYCVAHVCWVKETLNILLLLDLGNQRT